MFNLSNIFSPSKLRDAATEVIADSAAVVVGYVGFKRSNELGNVLEVKSTELKNAGQQYMNDKKIQNAYLRALKNEPTKERCKGHLRRVTVVTDTKRNLKFNQKTGELITKK